MYRIKNLPHPWAAGAGLLGALALVATACGSGSGGTSELRVGAAPTQGSAAEQARQLCSDAGLMAAEQYDSQATLIRVHPTTGQAFMQWESRDRGPGMPVPAQRQRASRPQEFMALCYYQGNFSSFPAAPGAEVEPYDVLGLTVDASNDVTVYVAAHSKTFDLDQAPPAS